MDSLNYDLILEEPHPIFMGPLPRDYVEVPTRVVVNLCGEYPAGDRTGHLTFFMPMFDVQERGLLPLRDDFELFLKEVHLCVSKEPSYWHCHAGINRSGMMLAAYLHLYLGMRISDAIRHLRRRRSPIVLCNSLFEQTLREWYGGAEEQEFVPFSIEAYLAGRIGSTV
jgi:hypothetical protein